ncbi:SMI1-KNR4 cell-wall [Streptomyces sp. 2323.1]|uniref:SMI1/KNR4 family protein n=1 Tax=Streptomyces sp. 2323.1 TaxID=1938841 RepID=UPI000BB82FEA|nr:SMI1/KNR4 family protein [Streptomyces sp. 2323.1]SOE08990.1 SMI1-KNR4 cell-wall [Streptomyces sp. 2323.1]
MNDLNRLQQLCPPPEPSHSPIEWTAVERALGTQLPSDYKKLVERYGTGSFKGFLSILQPNAAHEALDIVKVTPSARNAVEKMSEWVEPPCPPCQLQPVAVTSNGDDIFWLMDPPENPDSWKVTVNDLDSEEWFIFDGHLTAFLLGFCTNDVVVPSFPDDLLEKPASFTPTP